MKKTRRKKSRDTVTMEANDSVIAADNKTAKRDPEILQNTQ